MDMINCTVEVDKMGYLTVTFDDKRTIYLQTENERAQFGVSCGIIEAFKNWSGAGGTKTLKQLYNAPITT